MRDRAPRPSRPDQDGWQVADQDWLAHRPQPVGGELPDSTCPAHARNRPVLAEVMWDTKVDGKKAAKDSLTKACTFVSNKDKEHVIPALID